MKGTSNHCEAIKFGTEVGVTSARSPNQGYVSSGLTSNQGVGLYFLKRYAEFNKWKMRIISYNGDVVFGENQEHENPVRLVEGTVVGIEFSDNRKYLDYETVHNMICNEISSPSSEDDIEFL